MTQLRLPGMDPVHQIRPSAERKEPAFWVRRLRVVSELKSGAEHVVRDVELRRGLNIVWAPHAAVDENRLFQNGVAGHTAGKTTFCRLLRHVLGEPGIAAGATRRRMRARFSAGWVLAEVVVMSEVWIVARPLGVGPHPFCLRGTSVDDATSGEIPHQDYRVFLEAIAAVTVGVLPVARFPATDATVSWEHVLPWLARDQECRFADFLEWRHSASESDVSALNVDERQFLVRSVLGLISDAERAEQQRNAELVSKKKEAVQQEPLLAYRARSDRERVSKFLGIELTSPATPLFGAQARAELERQRDLLVRQEQDLATSDRRDELRTALEAAVAAETNAQRNLQEVEGRLALEREALSQLSGGASSALLAALPPPRDYCNVRMSVAFEQGCPLAVARPIDLASRRTERTVADELKLSRELVQMLEHSVAETQRAFENTGGATVAARRAFMFFATEFDQKRRQLHEARARLSQVDSLIGDSESALRQATELAEGVTRLSQEIDESYALQEVLRKAARESLARFSAVFDYIVRAILGNNVEARVDTSGRSLALIVEEHGERNSAAIETVKLLSFDLAALTGSAEGNGSFPRFLVHDGPREADMAADIYERLFLFARELEKCFVGDPGFQYIVTTTTSPPDEFLSEPWLRLELAGVPAEERLLRCDL